MQHTVVIEPHGAQSHMYTCKCIFAQLTKYGFMYYKQQFVLTTDDPVGALDDARHMLQNNLEHVAMQIVPCSFYGA